MKKAIVSAKILKNVEIFPDIFDMILESRELSSTARAGQFLKIYVDNNKNLLPRPISICEINKEENTLRVVYQKLGEGTEYFSNLEKGEFLRVIGNCGNGYTINNGATHILVGGGIGVPPLLETCKQLKGEKIVILGFRTGSYLKDDFEKAGAKVFVATDDGSIGFKGNVVELLKENNIQGDYIYSCGPKPMLSALTTYAKNNNIDIQVSLEERMACGVGGCVGCVAKINQNDEPVFKKVCKDGPVFNGLEVIF